MWRRFLSLTSLQAPRPQPGVLLLCHLLGPFSRLVRYIPATVFTHKFDDQTIGWSSSTLPNKKSAGYLEGSPFFNPLFFYLEKVHIGLIGFDSTGCAQITIPEWPRKVFFFRDFGLKKEEVMIKLPWKFGIVFPNTSASWHDIFLFFFLGVSVWLSLHLEMGGWLKYQI